MALAFAGGPVRTLGSGCCPEWGPDGSVYFTTDAGAVGVVGSGAGTVDVISRPADNEARHLVSDVLPDGRRALLEVRFPDGRTEIRGLDLRNRDTALVTEGVHPRYLSSGYLVYGSDAPPTTVMAARFDPGRMEMLGAPVPVVQDVRAFSLSDHGKLYYTYGPEQLWSFDRTVELIWVTRSGEPMPIDPEWTYIRGGSNHGWSLSPDGTSLALREFTEGNGNDIWIKEVDRGSRSRLTFHESEDLMPVWTPDGQHITFISFRGGGMDVWSKPADATGDAELVLDHDRNIAAVTWSPDGDWLLARTSGPAGAPGSRDILAFRPGVDTTATPLLAAPGYDERDASISPDGRFIAYTSNETGRGEVYVRPFPDVDADRWQISTQGGSSPIWAYSGRELFFVSRRRMMAMDVDTSSGFQHSTPRVLFEFESDWLGVPSAQYQLVTPDDQRFVLARDIGRAEDGTLMAGGVLVNNFVAEIEDLVSR